MSSNPKLTKARLSNLAKLDAYEPTGSTTRNVLQNTVKELFRKRNHPSHQKRNESHGFITG